MSRGSASCEPSCRQGPEGVTTTGLQLNVSNIDASVDFYEKVFGAAPAKRRPGYAKFDLAEPNLDLTMQEAPRTGVNASHFGVQVGSTEDVAAAWSRFKNAGLKTKTEGDKTCCYALQDKVWVEDPDGNMWEVFVVKGDATTMHDGPLETSPACCAPSTLAPEQPKRRSGPGHPPAGVR